MIKILIMIVIIKKVKIRRRKFMHLMYKRRKGEPVRVSITKWYVLIVVNMGIPRKRFKLFF